MNGYKLTIGTLNFTGHSIKIEHAAGLFSRNLKIIWLLRRKSYFSLTNKIVIMTIIKNLKPTESELEILQILWNKETATVREVHEELSKTKDSGYTTTLKLLQIMFEKGLVKRDDSNKTHIYEPAISKQRTQKQFLDKMINTLFAGSSAQLVLQALGNQKASKDELDEIQKYLDNLKK
jgi:predicted transcriptional regulator